MALALEQTLPIENNPHQSAEYSPESVVNIDNIEVRDGVARPRALGEVEHVGVRGRDLAVYFGPVVYRPDPAGLGGERVVFGMSVATEGGRRRQLLQHVAAPLRFTKGIDDENWPFERAMLDRFPALVAGKPTGELDQLVAPLPHAEMTERTMYESTAPGVGLETAVRAVAMARSLKGEARISDDEASLILQSLHDSSMRALQSLHGTEYVHRHSHHGNFNVSAVGRAMLFDYSDVAHPSELDLAPGQAWQGGPFEHDVKRFNKSWDKAMRNYGLPNIDPDGLPKDRSAAAKALEKLEPAIVRLALSEIGVMDATAQEVNSVIAAQRKVLDGAPTIAYPQGGRQMPEDTSLANEGSSRVYDVEADETELLFERGHELLKELSPAIPEQHMPSKLREEVAQQILQELEVRAVKRGRLDDESNWSGIIHRRYSYGDSVDALLKFERHQDREVLIGASVRKVLDGGREFEASVGQHGGLGKRWDIEYHIGWWKGERVFSKKNVYGAAQRALALVRDYALDRDAF